jgi:tripartite-type tricarboxylate transporter receptor subunit TctC
MGCHGHVAAGHVEDWVGRRARIRRQARAADEYPNKPIKLIVAAAPGGSTDLPARIASQILAPNFGQPVVVENRPGAGGALGARVVAASPPDGSFV